jgi:hypothetical protein
VFGVIWLFARHRRFFQDLWSARPQLSTIDWRAEIWPFQWRFAVSWMTGYFMFQIFNPILFATAGAVEAGQMGMSLMISTAIALFAQTWIVTRAVDYGSLVAARKFTILDRHFRSTLLQSLVVMLVLSAGFLGAVEVLRRLGHPLGSRVLPPLPLIMLLAATLLNHVVYAEATYLRAFKREPFLVIFAPMCALTAIGSVILAPRYGATGVVSVLLVSVATIGVCGGTLRFLQKRREWRSDEPLDDAVIAEMAQH